VFGVAQSKAWKCYFDDSFSQAATIEIVDSCVRVDPKKHFRADISNAIEYVHQ